MKIKITWSETRDTLVFDIINKDIAEWWINKCKELGNQFITTYIITDDPHKPLNINNLVEEIKHDVEYINKFMSKIKQPQFNLPTDWNDQAQLNKLHKDWAKSRADIPDLPAKLYKLDQHLFDCYHEMNCHIHLIEKSFHETFRDVNHWRVSNPFKDTFYEWQQSHLSMPYPGHGRTAFEKFKNCDNNINDDDWCNWDNLDSCVRLNLTRPYKEAIPEEFLNWCKEKGCVPHTNNIPIGNLEDWSNNLTDARATLLRNKKIPKNYFSFDFI
jgi:hypothetical protein